MVTAGSAEAAAFEETVRRARRDVENILRANDGGVAQACRAARDRLSLVDAPDPGDPGTWDGYGPLARDLNILVGFLGETRVPTSEPGSFRALVIRVLRYLDRAHLNETGVVLAEDVDRRWTAELGTRHPDQIAARERHAACRHALGAAQVALDLFDSAYRASQDLYGGQHPRTLGAAANVCTGLIAVADHTTALRLARYIVPICEQVLGPTSDTTTRAVSAIARSLYGLGDRTGGIAAFRDVHKRQLRAFGADRLETLEAADRLAAALAEVGDHEAARALNADAMARYERLLGKKDRRFEDARQRLRGSLRALGHEEESDAVYGPRPDW